MAQMRVFFFFVRLFVFYGWIYVLEGELLTSLKNLRDHLPPPRERLNGTHF